MSKFEKNYTPWNKKEDPKVTENKPAPELVVEPKDQAIATPAPAVQESKPQTFVIKTELDAYVNERLIGQPQNLAEVEVKDVSNDSLTMHMLKLPKKIQEALDSKDLVPHWINKDKRMIDRALDVRGWTLFNRVFFPNLPKHFFTANGTVEMGDCILGFMPAKKAEILRKRPGEISAERLKNLPIEAYKTSKGEEKIGYYKPAYTAEPDGVVERQGVGLYAQPDVSNVNE